MYPIKSPPQFTENAFTAIASGCDRQETYRGNWAFQNDPKRSTSNGQISLNYEKRFGL